MGIKIAFKPNIKSVKIYNPLKICLLNIGGYNVRYTKFKLTSLANIPRYKKNGPN